MSNEIASPVVPQPEPWLRGTHTDLPPVIRGVVHALEQAQEDITRWATPLSRQQLEVQVLGLPSVAFQLRHIARSLDRLLTYAEGNQLSEDQLLQLRSELTEETDREVLLKEVSHAFASTRLRILAFIGANLEEARGVGRKMLPTCIGGLLVHVAEHTMRHVGQSITTAKVVVAYTATAKP